MLSATMVRQMFEALDTARLLEMERQANAAAAQPQKGREMALYVAKESRGDESESFWLFDFELLEKFPWLEPWRRNIERGAFSLDVAAGLVHLLIECVD